MLGTPIPETPSPEFITSLGEQAIEPLLGGVGIGIYPGTAQLAAYQRVPLSGKPTSIVMEAIENLFGIAEEWESRLSADRQQTTKTPTAAPHHPAHAYRLKP